MKILKRIPVSTGDICIVQGELGKLELVSTAIRGKSLEEEWIVVVSTQYGCSMGCSFCDVPKVGPGLNASARDICDQVMLAVSLHPEVRACGCVRVHFTRMGEPSWNLGSVLGSAHEIRNSMVELG